MNKKLELDCEPKWVDLIDIFLDSNNKQFAKQELLKLAKIGDIVRQAQKEKEFVLISPSGKIRIGLQPEIKNCLEMKK